MRGDRVRRIWSRVLLAIVPLVAGIVVISAARASSTDAGPFGRAEVFGTVGDQRMPAREGYVIAQGRNAGGRCVFDQPVGVVVRVLSGDVGPAVVTEVDESCRLIITEIRDQVPASGRGGVEPSMVPAPPRSYGGRP